MNAIAAGGPNDRPDRRSGADRLDREFWAAELAGGPTRLPRWIAAPAGPARFQARAAQVPAELVAAARELARTAAVALAAIALAAYVVVIGAVAGEQRPVVGVRLGPAPALPCRLRTDGSWLELVQRAEQVCRDPRRRLGPAGLAELAELAGELAGEPADPWTPYEVVLAAGSAVRSPPARPLEVAALRLDWSTDPVRVRLDFRDDVLDSEFADRLLGYYLAALRHLTSDPTAAPDPARLLPAAERRRQLDGFSFRRRPLPDRRFHQLFEKRARQRPHAVVASHRATHWTYEELNRRANRLAWTLLERGVSAEQPVAVVMHRGLPWLASLIAILKVGAAYLPIEPEFPRQRIAGMLRRSDCRLAVTEPSLAAAPTTAWPVDQVIASEAFASDRSGEDPAVPVSGDQLAYIFFTSGSTGEPKGAMCEHAGMLNHLLAKVEDLRITAGTTVAQTAPQCFDISVWQLLAAPMMGGRVVIIDSQDLLDVERFLDRVRSEEVTVLQLVPSYVDALLADLPAARAGLAGLRYLSVTGEALRPSLVQRWFRAFPGVPLVNAYGLTETSDDTNHAVLTAPPLRDRVPLGPPIRNVRALVLDERLEPVPLGAPGEIVFAGVCVGRGYINDAERTRQAFVADPHHPGGLLYRTGDYGRWLSDGSLEFLGRRDQQVKVRGFRVEIGEVESSLERVAGLAPSAVVVTGPPADQRLVACYAGPTAVAGTEIRAKLAAVLPDYMIPEHFCRIDALPLTSNGKVDRTALAALAERSAAPVEAGVADRLPATPTERRLAEAWAEVLAVPVGTVGRFDDFFATGGTSLTAIRLVVRLERAVSLATVAAHPVLADLAQQLENGGPAG
jgi:amino acid adenylation domain-containing protein